MPQTNCRFNHTDEERLPHKCNATCGLTPIGCLQYMRQFQSTFTFQHPNPVRTIISRSKLVEQIPGFFSRKVDA